MSYIKGLNSLLSKLNSLPDMIQEGALDGVQKSIDIIEEDAKELCPVDTGDLQDSIQSKVTELSSSEVLGVVSTDVEYASSVEFGSSDDNRAPHPFLYPAYDMNEQNIDNTIKEEINNKLKELAKR